MLLTYLNIGLLFVGYCLAIYIWRKLIKQSKNQAQTIKNERKY